MCLCIGWTFLLVLGGLTDVSISFGELAIRLTLLILTRLSGIWDLDWDNWIPPTALHGSFSSRLVDGEAEF